jgi:hypothetical protein
MMVYYFYFMSSVWKREKLSLGYRIFALGFTSIAMTVVLLGTLATLFVIIRRILGLSMGPTP